MNFSPKAPPVYKPGLSNTSGGPHPVVQQTVPRTYGNHQPPRQAKPLPQPNMNLMTPSQRGGAAGSAGVQAKLRAAKVESRPAPPVYRPKQPVSQLKPASVAPAVYRPIVPASAGSTGRRDRASHPFPARHQPVLMHNGFRPQTAVQAKFTPDPTFSSSGNLMAAFDLFNAAIDQMPGSNVAKLRASATVDVQFTAGPMEESKAHSSIDVPDPDKDDALCPLAMVAQRQNLAGRTGLEITMAMNSSSTKPYFSLARTMAHELAGHVAPYVDILEKIKAGRGMSGADQDRILTGGARGGAMEHAGMVGGRNVEYDTLVHQMASRLSTADAVAMAKDYLIDISRYDPRNGRVFTQEDEQEFIRQFNEAKQGIAWIAELTARSEAEQRRLAQRRGYLSPGQALILLAIVVFVIARMLA